MQKISPFLWFNDQAEEAAEYYVSIFTNSRIVNVSRFPSTTPGYAGRPGHAMSVTFELDGLEVQALNGGPSFSFTEAISLFVHAETQPEIDDLWAKLSAGGRESQCGWLQDKFGLSWQITPSVLEQLLSDPDPARAGRVMQAMLAMSKIDIALLRAAADTEKPSDSE
ncbi:3-demethylubiquinone-9 3-methyltransferase [Cryobacterium roopkundense]|uniref:3-demethylubiquinone-9 3-methyltransferase n=2 Tax=Cryobacterium roopkundense TaxID=1001240 RepID=A0A099J4D1_9MICO|nr:VOC family protein [Cryobacterium roopkundense]KGJ72392.1 3-demethylubiquinone-9 3-methyltransferase [Cryobacterium roopkundense]MBB5640752.1 putative 3-demethylubiquinone-9 3-methyltransferase (glyoxalase superfamily) [Cryobacterium roopkundense]